MSEGDSTEASPEGEAQSYRERYAEVDVDRGVALGLRDHARVLLLEERKIFLVQLNTGLGFDDLTLSSHPTETANCQSDEHGSEWENGASGDDGGVALHKAWVDDTRRAAWCGDGVLGTHVARVGTWARVEAIGAIRAV